MPSRSIKEVSKETRLVLCGIPKHRLVPAVASRGVCTIDALDIIGYHSSRSSQDLFVISAICLLDSAFVDTFRDKTTRDARLLVLNNCLSADSVASRFIDLQIRSRFRFYVAEFKSNTRLEDQWPAVESLILRCIASPSKSSESANRILDARLEDDCLKVVSPDFRRLEIPTSKIPAFAQIEASKLVEFELDEDGFYLYWPELDIHLVWEQLEEIADPAAARKAFQKLKEFNVRYGAAIQKTREAYKIGANAIPDLSYKQVKRIEKGECRATSNALEKLARAHQLELDEYLARLSQSLE